LPLPLTGHGTSCKSRITSDVLSPPLTQYTSISFFTQFITGAIDYFYGLVFACCCLALAAIVFFFVIESKDRSLEEIDTMYLLGVNPITSASWDGSKLPESTETSNRNSSEIEAQRALSIERVPTAKSIHE
jgi:MFS transporter, SP family, sugar:H+ symporter